MPDSEREAAGNQSGTAVTTEKAPKVQILPFEDKHVPGVLALYAEVFGYEDSKVYEKRWRWCQRENLVPDNSPAWVAVAGDTVVGFLGTVPQRYVIDGQEIVAYTTADYMVHPDHRFHGLALMKRFFKECENCITADDVEATIKVTKWLGAKEAGILQRRVKLLDARSITDKPRFRGYPQFPLLPLTMWLRLKDRFRSANKGSNVKIERCEQFDERFVRLNEQLAGPGRAVVKRDIEFLNWRYGKKSPQSARSIVTATLENGDLAGYAVYMIGGETRRYGYLLDLQLAPGSDKSVAEALLKAAMSDLRSMGAWSCRYHGVAPQGTPGNPPEPTPVTEALDSWGFATRIGYYLLVKLKDKRLMEVAMKDENWNYLYGDTEASYSISEPS